MQTYTHYVMTAVIKQRIKAREQRLQPGEPGRELYRERMPPLRSGWLMLGSIMPDLPLIVISIICMLLDLNAGNRLDPGNQAAAHQSYTGYLFDYMFFHEPWVMAAHNLFHAPLLIIVYIALGYWAWKKGMGWGSALFWLGCACALHTAIDIPLHYDDGPLLFFPFDWQTRFYSPISYWDPRRYGVPFAIFEHLLLIGMLLYLAVNWWRRRYTESTIPVINVSE